MKCRWKSLGTLLLALGMLGGCSSAAPRAAAETRPEPTMQEAQDQEADLARAQREQEVQRLFDRVFEFQRDKEYERALEVLDQILFLEPDHRGAQALKTMLEDTAIYMRVRDAIRERELESAELHASGVESGIPYDVLQTFPNDWPELTEHRHEP